MVPTEVRRARQTHRATPHGDIKADELSKATLGDARAGFFDNGVKKMIVAHRQEPAAIRCCDDHACFPSCKRHRFFHKDMAARPQRRTHQRSVRCWRCQDMNGVWSRQPQQAFQIAGHQADPTLSGKRSCSVQISVGHSDDLDTLQLLENLKMDFSHPSAPSETHSYHGA